MVWMDEGNENKKKKLNSEENFVLSPGLLKSNVSWNLELFCNSFAALLSLCVIVIVKRAKFFILYVCFYYDFFYYITEAKMPIDFVYIYSFRNLTYYF